MEKQKIIEDVRGKMSLCIAVYFSLNACTAALAFSGMLVGGFQVCLLQRHCGLNTKGITGGDRLRSIFDGELQVSFKSNGKPAELFFCRSLQGKSRENPQDWTG